MVQEPFADRDDPVREQVRIGGRAIRAGVDLTLDQGPVPGHEPTAKNAVDSGEQFKAGAPLVLEERVDALIAPEVVEELDAHRQNQGQARLAPVRAEHVIGDRRRLGPHRVGEQPFAVAGPAIQRRAGDAEVGGEMNHVEPPPLTEVFTCALERGQPG